MTLSQEDFVNGVADRLVARRKLRSSITLGDIKDLIFEFGLDKETTQAVLLAYYSSPAGQVEIRSSGHADKSAYDVVRLIMQTVDRM